MAGIPCLAGMIYGGSSRLSGSIFFYLRRTGFIRGSLGAEGASEVGEGFDDLCGPLREFVVAEGAVVGLEDGAQEEGVDVGVFCVAPDFDGF